VPLVCAAMDRPLDATPLQGMRVVEVAGGVPAAFCTHLLAGYGAEVVRVEGFDDPTWTLDADSAVYLLPGKRRVTAGRGAHDDLARLVAGADVVVVDGRPGRCDVAAWRRARPGLVAVTVAPFGQTGPDRDLPADDLIAFAAGGTLSLTGDPASTPLVTGGAQALWFGGLHAFSAALGAYYGAVVHGSGGWVDLSLQECLAGALELYAPAAAHGEPAALRFGNYHRAVWAVYPCADGYAGVFCLERQVPALFALIGDPELQDERFTDPLQRPLHDEELSAYVLSFMVQHTGDELLRLGAEHRIPFGKVRTPAELIAGAALAERGFLDTVVLPDGPGTAGLGVPPGSMPSGPVPPGSIPSSTVPTGTVRVPGRPFAGFGWSGGGDVPALEDTAALGAVAEAWGTR